jgi:RNA polymerase sigma factor (sigma-70 family)
MPTSPMSEVLQYLRSALLAEGADLTDAQLLECFVSRREPAALEALVRRHGPMVWGVCRRVLGNHHDAEDAFQAAFLVLTRKAASIYPRAKVGCWLHGVARQTALKARATRAKRRVRERPVTEVPEPAVMDQDLWHDLEPLLDQEVTRLPEKYQTVIVLCDLEGKTLRDAAQQLGCPQGTAASRLARARAMLAKRLARHGFAWSSGALVGVLGQRAVSASVPASVMTATVNAVTLVAAGEAASSLISPRVAALSEGVMKAMLLNKLTKITALLVFLATTLTGAGLLSSTRWEEKGKDERQQQNEQGRRSQNKAKKPLVSLADWPAGAPIKLWPRFGRTAVGRQTAERQVRQYLGIGKGKKLRLTPPYFTDNDFPFLRLQKHAIWLAVVKNLSLPSPQGEGTTVRGQKAGILPRLYIAIDAKSGQLIEAFTPPAYPWWRYKAQVVGPAHEQYLRETGQVFQRPSDPPKLTVEAALQGMSEEQGPGQLVVRYVLYTNRKSGRTEGDRFIPVAKRRPALVVFREGLQLKTRSGEAIGRAMIVLDAQTGAPLYNEFSGNPASKPGDS